MTDNTKSPKHKFVHFHLCVSCGSAFRREEYEGRALTSGIYRCPKCGFESPLNVVIREVEEPEDNHEDLPDDRSSR